MGGLGLLAVRRSLLRGEGGKAEEQRSGETGDHGQPHEGVGRQLRDGGALPGRRGDIAAESVGLGYESERDGFTCGGT